MRLFIRFFFAVAFLCQAFTVKAQSFNSDSLLTRFTTNYPQEKVFVQTDRTTYFPGETIWMKAWCTVDGIPSYLSRVLYIELVNSAGQVTQKKMYKLDSLGSTPADIDLGPSIPSGTYSLNAYTLWMQNFPGFVFRKEIFIYGNDYKAGSPSPVPPAIKLQFFPEGGDMIEGLNNRIAFKAVTGNGMPVEVKGFITDNNGNKITEFSSEHDGMGAFEVYTEQGKQYLANIPAGNGADLQFKLPAAKNEGITLKIENGNPQKLFVLLDRSEKNKERYAKIKVIAETNGRVIYEANLDLDKDQNAFSLDKKKLPAGIIHFTAFSSDHTPLAERLAFSANYEVLQPAINNDTLNLKARSKNHLSFTLPGVGQSSLAVSVVNAVNGKDHAENNIASSFLLTSDLKGYIHEPGYYFKDKETVTLRHLDFLLMTQGWRRFEWKKLMANQFPELKYPVESGIWLTGKVTKSDRKEPVKDGKVSFIIKGDDSTTILGEAGITDKGEFLLNDLSFLKKATIAYQGTNSKKEKLIVDVYLHPPYIDTLKRSVNKPQADLDTANVTGSDVLSKYFKNHVKPDTTAKFLGNVTVKSKRISRPDSLNNEYASGLFSMGKAVDPSAYQHYTSPWQILQVSEPGIRVEGNIFDPNVYFTRFQGLDAISQNNSSFSIDGAGGESIGIILQENGIAYYLNEINVAKDVINSLSVDDIALIKVLKTEGAALGATAGAIAFYTKKGVPVGNSVYEKAFTKIQKEGYAIVRQFYVPDVTAVPPGTDNRLTLYWNSAMKPGKDGKYHLRFINDDVTGAYRLVIQGIDKSGKLIYAEQVLR